MASSVKTPKSKKTAPQAATSKPRADINGWVLCPGDGVLIISPGEEYHGLFGKVDAFPTKLELSSYVQLDDRPTTSGRVLLPNAQLRWMGPDPDRLDVHRPMRPGQRVRVVLDDDRKDASDELKRMEGQLATTMDFAYASNECVMVTVTFEAPELAPWPLVIKSTDLLVVPIPVVQYVPESEEASVPEVRMSTQAWNMLKVMGAVAIPQQLYSKQAQPLGAELVEAGFIEQVAGESGYQLTDAGRAALPTDDIAPAAAAPVATEHPAEFRNIPLEQIAVTRNTRQVFDETALTELAQSIRERGVIAPIVVRLHPDGLTVSATYELVAGERRFRASKLAGLATIPAMVRVLSDREFMEVQLLENLQRVDVRPADEAQAFAELLKNGFPIEEIAAKVGKPARFVAERARLMELLPEWVEALQQDRLLIGSAQQLARLTRAQQADVYKLLQRSWGELVEIDGVRLPVFGASEIRQQIDRQCKPHDLDSAAFPKDDALLHPAAGACVTCPKRTGNTLYLFDDLGGNQCLDGNCFAVKVSRYVERQLNELGREGQPVLKVADHWSRVPADTLNLNKWQSPENFKPEKLTELREAGQVRSALMTEGPRAGHVVEIVLPAEVAQQPDVVAAIKQQRQAETDKQKQEAVKVRALGAARRQAHYQLSTDLRGPGLHTAVVLRRMLYRDLEYNRPNHVREMLQQVYGWGELSNKSYLADGDKNQVREYLAAMETPALYALLVDLELLGWLHEEHPRHLPALCKELGWADEQLLAAHAERKKGAKA